MAGRRFVVAGGGVVGASIAYHLAERGADEVLLAETGTVASGATGKALGGVRQQFSSAPEVRLAKESVAFFRSLGAELFAAVGYLFIATTEDGLRQLEERREVQLGLGVPVETADPARVVGLAVDDVVGAVFCAEDGTADPVGVTRELVRRAVNLGVEVHEHTDALELEGDVLVLATGAASAAIGAKLGVELPVAPLVRQLVETEPVPGLPTDLPLVVEAESGFHFRRRGAGLVLAMPEPDLRWGFKEEVEQSLVDDWLERAPRDGHPPAAGVPVARAWAGLYDMTPDAHPIIGPVNDGLYVACGFSGHGFMQAPAVGRIVADELDRDPGFDLAPYRLERFASGSLAPEMNVL